MFYIFVVNGRSDKSSIQSDIRAQMRDKGIAYDVYITTGSGDATRFVNLYCDLNPKKEVCFIACGGAGTTTEVAAGIIGRGNKHLAILALAGSNDLIKTFPGRDFSTVDGILHGECTRIDALKVNDYYAINVISVGMDAMAAHYANVYNESGHSHSYDKGILKAIMLNRINRIRVVADGEVLNKRILLLAAFGNGQFYGSKFRCTPFAVPDDGLMDICIMSTIALAGIGYAFNKYQEGTHLSGKWPLSRIFKFKRAKHVELHSDRLIHINLDGEIIAARNVSIDVIEKSVNLILPKQ